MHEHYEVQLENVHVTQNSNAQHETGISGLVEASKTHRHVERSELSGPIDGKG